MSVSCKKCGLPLEKDTVFCPRCGYQVSALPEPTPTDEPLCQPIAAPVPEPAVPTPTVEPLRQPIATPVSEPAVPQSPSDNTTAKPAKKTANNKKILIIILCCVIGALVIALAAYFIIGAITNSSPGNVPTPGIQGSSKPVNTPNAPTAGDDSNVNTSATLQDFCGQWKGPSQCTAVSGITENKQALLDMGVSEEDIAGLEAVTGTQSEFNFGVLPSGKWNIYMPVSTGEMSFECDELMTDEEKKAGQAQKYYISPSNGRFEINSSVEESEGTVVFSISAALTTDRTLVGTLTYGMDAGNGVNIMFDYSFTAEYAGAISEDGDGTQTVPAQAATTSSGQSSGGQSSGGSKLSVANISGQYSGEWYEGESVSVVMNIEQSGSTVNISIRQASDGYRLFEYSGGQSVYNTSNGKLYINFGDGTDISLQFYIASDTLVCEGDYNTYSGLVSVWLSRSN